eukprot:3788386-Alexandrium_andersonii.AAC.1
MMCTLVLHARVCARWSTCALALHVHTTAPCPDKLSFRRACAGIEVVLTPGEAAGDGALCARHGGQRTRKAATARPPPEALRPRRPPA